MRKRLALLAMLLAIGPPASAAKVFIDYDRNFDRTGVKTFQWMETDELTLEEDQPLLHSRIVNAIEHYLTEAGLQEVDANPDVYVTYHTDAKEEMVLNTTNFGYGYGGGWYYDPRWGPYGGMGTSTTTVTTYTRGTLIIDIWDAASEKIIWRGTATDIVPANPQKAGKTIDKWLRKLVHEWDKIVAREAKEKAKAAKN